MPRMHGWASLTNPVFFCQLNHDDHGKIIYTDSTCPFSTCFYWTRPIIFDNTQWHFLFRRGSYHPSFLFSVASCGSSFDRAPPFPATRLRYAMLDLITIFSAAGLQQELKSAHGDKSRLGWDGGCSLFGKSGWKLQNYRSTWNPRIAVSKRFKDLNPSVGVPP